MPTLIFWGVIFVAMLIAEIESMQFITIWFAAGAAGAFIAALMGASFALQMIIFVAVSLLLLLATRPLFAKMRVKQQPRTNADLNIGETAVVIEEINAALGTGRVRIAGVDWSAVAETGEIISPETIVIVTNIDSAKLIVRDAAKYAQSRTPIQ